MNQETHTSYPSGSLRANLAYEPQELKFGTSGRRGEVIHLTQLEIYINALADLDYLQSLPASEGGITRGDGFCFAYDLRPSSTRFVPEQGGRGEIAQAVVQAIEDAGMRPFNLGAIPTPALMYSAMGRGWGSIMITGSHIPFDRNGFKTSTATRELLKIDEAPISRRVAEVREEVYRQPFADSPFDAQGRFKGGPRDLPPVLDVGRSAYFARYLSFFLEASPSLEPVGKSPESVKPQTEGLPAARPEAGSAVLSMLPLAGKRLLVYQHSAVGRDLLTELLAALGAEVAPAGRSDTFVPIDTENIDAERLAAIQALLDAATAQYGRFDGILSIDGDSDRPLVLGVSPDGKAQFFGGDLLGMVVAEYLGADAVVVPISCNDAIDRSNLKERLEPKTRIGSPYVIAGMEQAKQKGRKVVCGWEANGGFLLGSDIEHDRRVLRALPTRDALLPILCVLFAAQQKGVTLPELFDALPQRFSKAALLKNFPRAIGQQIVARFSPSDSRSMETIQNDLEAFFPSENSFGAIVGLDYTDGVRLTFENGEVVHFRPSGNADEFRIYAVADSPQRAEKMALLGIAEPDGILRRMERAVAG
jgi:phosphomannomutase